MAEKHTAVVVGKVQTAQTVGQLGPFVSRTLFELGLKVSYKAFENPLRPELFSRAVPELKEKLGQINFLVYVPDPLDKGLTVYDLAQDLLLDFKLVIIGLVNAVCELYPLFTRTTKVLVIGPVIDGGGRLRSGSTVAKMYSATFDLMIDTPALGGLEFRHYPVVESGFAWLNEREIYDKIRQWIAEQVQEEIAIR